MPKDLDMVRRDPNNLNDHVKVRIVFVIEKKSLIVYLRTAEVFVCLLACCIRP